MPAPARSAPHRGRVGESFASDLLELVPRCVAPGHSFQNFRGHMGTGAGLGPGNVFADLVRHRAQKRGHSRIEHRRPHKKINA